MKAIQKHFLFFLALSGILLLVILITPYFQPQKTSSYDPEETKQYFLPEMFHACRQETPSG